MKPVQPFNHQSSFAHDIAKLIAWIHQGGYYATFGKVMSEHTNPEELLCFRVLSFNLCIIDHDGAPIKKSEGEVMALYWNSLHADNFWYLHPNPENGYVFERRVQR